MVRKLLKSLLDQAKRSSKYYVTTNNVAITLFELKPIIIQTKSILTVLELRFD